MRILYVQPGPNVPSNDNRLEKMFFVPEPVCGDILVPTWYREESRIRDILGPDSFPQHRIGNFTFHFHLTPKNLPFGHPLQKLSAFAFYLRQGFRLIRKNKYDCIITYGWTLTGVVAYILRWASGAKLIVEFGIAPHNYNRFGRFKSTKVTWGMRAGKIASDLLLNLIGGSADRVQLRYPTQLEFYPRVQKTPASILHGFIPISNISSTGESENTILLVGGPWYLKGVDLLIHAFHKVKNEFPETKLCVLGHYPDREALDALVAGEPRIEVMAARKNAAVLEVLSKISVFVLASRTEAGGRVLLEAMAAGKPIIVSSADGNPYYVRDGVNGLVFETENADDLAEKLRMLLGSPELRRKFGEKGYELAHSVYSERNFGMAFGEMVRLTVEGSNASSSSGGQERTPVHVER